MSKHGSFVLLSLVLALAMMGAIAATSPERQAEIARIHEM